ncbi:family 16 glycosylhydrolase [Adhaeretor mobilis]|uniref:Beta-porphyranase B n=1 Tax=Adhaeretor mobilis TaxID=1930276 RepID=A0A517MUC9_9BACT|nr:family 16 glycosylhydrolase [Adhaeretor mobilis]QDS98493.1 Beta-porphyranase B precursor [Adhaeretor mobilis]
MMNSLPIFTAACLIATGSTIAAAQPAVYPVADPKNQGEWHLNDAVSDEFEGTTLDEKKWHIQGTNGEYRSNFIGRAPSQFSTKNVRIEAGKLKLQAKWEPDFDFSKKIDKSDKKAPEGRPYENITTAAVISKQQFLYGYMEIKCKAADASVTSSFWMTGNGVELDVFEFLARPAQTHKKQLPRELWSSIHDWSPEGKGKTTWTDRLQLDWKVADDFHVYGIEWDENYLKFHADGKLVRSVTRQEVGEEGWVITKPLWVWVDSETFPWHGIPEKNDLPVDFEIEYIRIWQKSLTSNIPLSFEGPFALEEKSQDWWMTEPSRKHLAIVDEKAASGSKSLKFSDSGPLEEKVTAFAPYGSSDLEPGRYEFSMKAWLEPECDVKRVRIVLEEPWLELKPLDLSGVEKGKWVTISQTFRRSDPSSAKDRIRVVVQPEDVSGSGQALYIDDLSIEKTE